MIDEDIKSKLENFGKRGWTLKPYNVWGPNKPCPPRLVVNSYKGCVFQHQYCYINSPAQQQKGFREHLTNRVNEAKELGLNSLVVMVSSSTDPFQPIEKKFRDSHFALNQLLENGFPVLIMTRNPQTLLEKDYLEITNHPKLNIDVSIPSLEENNPQSIYYSPIAEPLEETFEAIKILAIREKYVRIKIEPVVPSIKDVHGQSQEELDEIVRKSAQAGVKGIISKTMRLNHSVPKFMYDNLIEYYQQNGVNESFTWALNINLRQNLMQPVLDACKKYEVSFCPCVDSDSIIGGSCRLGAFGSHKED